MKSQTVAETVPESSLDDLVRRLSASKFNYWAGYVANLILTFWLASQALTLSPEGVTSHLSVLEWALCAVAGLLFWSLTEYVFHRYLYHEVPSPLSKGHGMHHDDPQALLGVPWYLTTIALIAIYYGMAAIFPPAGTGVVMAFAWLGYIGYCFIHHSIHHFKFPFAWFKALHKHHLIHHVHPEINHGITTTLWDYVFGTKRR